jgi:cytosine/adenosine deaminase-related metal-dependent hydrolase
VSPALFAAIRADLDAHWPPVSSVHLGESADEVELLRHGTGAVRDTLEELGVWTDEWRVPGASPVEYLSELGFLDSRVLVVHGVQFDGEDLTRLNAMGATLVSCPRSNRYVGVGSPPLEAFYAMDVEVAFGTDSLASVRDLNMFAELAEAHRLAPRVPPRRLLESATLTGARALGFDREFGSIEKGKMAALIAVRVPGGVTDVEEYLVSGVEPDAIMWLDTSIPNSQFPTPNPGVSKTLDDA